MKIREVAHIFGPLYSTVKFMHQFLASYGLGNISSGLPAGVIVVNSEVVGMAPGCSTPFRQSRTKNKTIRTKNRFEQKRPSQDFPSMMTSHIRTE
jgi:hypothetical protein